MLGNSVTACYNTTIVFVVMGNPSTKEGEETAELLDWRGCDIRFCQDTIDICTKFLG